MRMRVEWTANVKRMERDGGCEFQISASMSCLPGQVTAKVFLAYEKLKALTARDPPAIAQPATEAEAPSDSRGGGAATTREPRAIRRAPRSPWPCAWAQRRMHPFARIPSQVKAEAVPVKEKVVLDDGGVIV